MAKTKAKRKVNQFRIPTTKQEKLADIAIRESKRTDGKKSKTNMLLEAGYSMMTARANVQKAFTTTGFLEALERRGVTHDKITKVFDDAIQAKTVVVHKGEAYESNAPDHKTRLSAVNSLGDYTGMRKTHVSTTSVNVDINTEDLADLLGLG
tara:strand:- start:97 stop:552 length:456 start_codon:yes stop_codon:yes gene_type:complete